MASIPTWAKKINFRSCCCLGTSNILWRWKCNTCGHGLFMAGLTCKTMERQISQQPEQRKATKKSNRNLSPCLFVLDGGGDSISRHGDLAGSNGRIYPVRACYLPHTPALTTGGLRVMTYICTIMNKN